MRRYLPASLVMLALVLPMSTPARARPNHSPCCGVVTAQGRRLRDLIDSMHVERLWQAHDHIDWETGERDRPIGSPGPGRETHCSAFAAAVGERLGVYMLRPPEHSQILLASAQTVWFREPDGVSQGWKPLDGSGRERRAQTLANQGSLVVIAYESPNPDAPGHIVVVRPAAKSVAALKAEGPEVAEAGVTNFSDTVAATAFGRHPGAWPDGVRYYWHTVGAPEAPHTSP